MGRRDQEGRGYSNRKGMERCTVQATAIGAREKNGARQHAQEKERERARESVSAAV